MKNSQSEELTVPNCYLKILIVAFASQLGVLYLTIMWSHFEITSLQGAFL
jgi:hypothetical protein